mmetsp:Transcript_17987/g.39748  ORF Transcript_17987/g.39748 Transcript_17987/m.39748 type:complete len:85 (+) Transcript_17987:1781-2035(+)
MGSATTFGTTSDPPAGDAAVVLRVGAPPELVASRRCFFLGDTSSCWLRVASRQVHRGVPFVFVFFHFAGRDQAPVFHQMTESCC